jgi:hypothetical protein
MTNTVTRGRKPALTDKFEIVSALCAIRDGNKAEAPSRYLTYKLVHKGLVDVEKVKTSTGRGAPKAVFVVTGRGRNYINLSARWGTK